MISNENVEIKEILNFKEDADYKRLSVDEITILRDYITNLQEENDELKEQCKQWKENHKAVCIQRDNILNNTVKDIEEQIDYKSRNKKAIEYVKSKKAIINTDYIRIFDLFKIDEQGYTDELLKILQGNDKE